MKTISLIKNVAYAVIDSINELVEENAKLRAELDAIKVDPYNRVVK